MLVAQERAERAGSTGVSERAAVAHPSGSVTFASMTVPISRYTAAHN
jgi:hypothetical protein